MSKSPRFTKDTLPFLASAHDQRNPDWLERDHDTYDRILRHPYQHLARAIAQDLKTVAPRYHVPVQGVGRLKIPGYKVGKGDPLFKSTLSIRTTTPSGSRFIYNPHLIFALLPNEPGWEGVFVIGGMFKPKSEQIKRVRQMIEAEPRPYHDLFDDPAFRARFKTDFSTTETNVRPPRGFDPNHPDIEWIKLRNFTVVRKLTTAEFTSPDLADEVIADFRQLVRLNKLLSVAIAD